MSSPRFGRFSSFTPRLAFACFCLLVGDVLFGFDTGSFGGILAQPGFVKQFGEYQSSTNAYKISTTRTSLLSSLAFVGKFIGCFAAGPSIERLGHRMVFAVLSAISCAGIIIEITSAGTTAGSGRPAQFIAGRILVYISIGLVEVCVTTYQSEIVPAPLRGFVVVSLQLFLAVGQILATSVNKAFSRDTTGHGWKTVTGIQFVFPVLIALFVPFIPDSPRWLLSKGRRGDALSAMQSVRTAAEVESGKVEQEISCIEAALAANVEKAPWSALVKGTNLRRTVLVLVCYTFQQIVGQAFVSTYQTVFYRTNGYADKAFVYPIIASCLAALGVVGTMLSIDRVGRKWLLWISGSLQALFMFLLAGIGSRSTKSGSQKQLIVASLMLYTISYNMGWGGIPYLLGAEIANGAVREKTASVGTALNVFWAWLTNFILPYMLAALNVKIGYIFGSICVLSVLFVFFFLPETKGLALEDIDRLFDKPFNPFRASEIRKQAIGEGTQLAHAKSPLTEGPTLEGGDAELDDDKATVERIA